MRVPAALPFCRHSLSPIRFMSCLSVPAPYLSSPGSSPPSPRAARAAPQKTTRGACASASRPPRDALGSLARAPSDGQESPKRPPGRPQEAPTLASRPEDGRRWLQDASRTAQGAQRRPPPERGKSVEHCNAFNVSARPARGSQDVPISLQEGRPGPPRLPNTAPSNGLKTPPWSPRMAQQGPKMATRDTQDRLTEAPKIGPR